MPKIKVKNIPSKVVDKLCDQHVHCIGCILHLTTMTNGLEVRCMRDPRLKPQETIITLSEKEFPTNREWLESLSDDDLAAFYTLGIQLKDKSYINLYRVAMSFTSSQQDIKDWLSKPCRYLMEEE